MKFVKEIMRVVWDDVPKEAGDVGACAEHSNTHQRLGGFFDIGSDA